MMKDNALQRYLDAARARLRRDGWPLDPSSLHVWQPPDLARLETLVVKADAVLADADRELRAVMANPDLSDSAKHRKRTEALTRLRERLGTLEQDAASINAEIDALTTRASRLSLDARGHFTERTVEQSPVAEQRRQEVRALLRALPESERLPRILDAVAAGDLDVIDALDGPATATFPLVNEDGRQRIEQALVERSPAFPHILSGRQLQSFASMVVTHAKQRVADLETHGPRAATPTDDPFAWSGPSAA